MVSGKELTAKKNKLHSVTHEVRQKRNVKIRDDFVKAFEEYKKTGKKAELSWWHKSHEHQWYDLGKSWNIMATGTACRNDCLYCYVKPMNSRFGREVEIEDLFKCHERRVDKGWKEAKSEDKKYLYMFPTTHDIFPEMVDNYISVAKKMLKAGHSLLVVSKPMKVCVKKIIEELEEWKDRVWFRFSISSMDEDLVKIWEPRAPSTKERIECLKMVRKAGYESSVSIEPYISDPREVYEAVKEFCTQGVWIGLMNHKHAIEGFDKIKDLFEMKYVIKLVNDLKNEKDIFWKESIMQMFVKFGKFVVEK